MAQLIRFFQPDIGIRIGLLEAGQVRDVTPHVGSIAAWLRASAGRAGLAIEALSAYAETVSAEMDAATLGSPGSDRAYWLAPVDTQEVWAAGVTYRRSRDARQEEAIDGGDVYARVYNAARPELFFKALGPKVVGPGDHIGIRMDAAWNVPEPELALVMNPAMEVIGFTIGNDVSSRDIEGENPLYLPQAKVYDASCALGPGIELNLLDAWPDTTITLTIERDQVVVFNNQIHTDQIHRRLPELVGYLGRSSTYPDGVVLLTGTGIIPPADFTLVQGDVVRIAVAGLGELTNTVKAV